MSLLEHAKLLVGAGHFDQAVRKAALILMKADKHRTRHCKELHIIHQFIARLQATSRAACFTELLHQSG
jgi:hypothetical protein